MAQDKASVTNAFAYLEEDHQLVAGLLEKLADTTENAIKTRADLFPQLKDALTLHALIEEKILYPALEEVKATHEITMEAFEEHHVVKLLLAELDAGGQQSEEWTAKLTVLKENVEHHVKEEEGDMFVKARKALNAEQQERLAKAMQAFLETAKH
jgi:hemerythrin superfamily protein